MFLHMPINTNALCKYGLYIIYTTITWALLVTFSTILVFIDRLHLHSPS